LNLCEDIHHDSYRAI